MELREFLEQHERELLEQIDFEHRQIKLHELKLVPLEGELAEVRRAMAAVGMSNPLMPGGIGLPFSSGIGSASLGDLLPSGGIGSFGSPTLRPISELGQIAEALALGSPYADLTMKQLVVKALDEHFRNGATTRKLIDFFRDAWGRNIERTNLSPQLSRLYQEGVIGRAAGYKEWHLMRRTGDIGGYRGFVQRHNKEVVHMLPEQARPEEHSPILTTNDPAPDPDDD